MPQHDAALEPCDHKMKTDINGACGLHIPLTHIVKIRQTCPRTLGRCWRCWRWEWARRRPVRREYGARRNGASVNHQSSVSCLATPHRDNTHLLWAPAVDNFLRVLCFLAILPCQINDECSVLFILAHVHRLDIFIPAAAWGLPLALLEAGGRGRIFRMTVPPRALGLGGGGGLGLSAALSTLEGVVCLLKYLLSAPDAPKVLFQGLCCVVSGEGRYIRQSRHVMQGNVPGEGVALTVGSPRAPRCGPTSCRSPPILLQSEALPI